MVDVLPEWTVRGEKSSECVERKDGSESQTDVQSQNRKETDVFERHSNPNRCTWTTNSNTTHGAKKNKCKIIWFVSSK